MNENNKLGITHITPDIRVNGNRLTRASKIHLGTRDGQPIKPIRADRLANLTAQFKNARLTLDEVAALADGGEVRGVSCGTLGIRREEVRGVLIIQAVSQTVGRGRKLPEPAKRAIEHVFGLTRKRLEDIVSR